MTTVSSPLLILLASSFLILACQSAPPRVETSLSTPHASTVLARPSYQVQSHVEALTQLASVLPKDTVFVMTMDVDRVTELFINKLLVPQLRRRFPVERREALADALSTFLLQRTGYDLLSVERVTVAISEQGWMGFIFSGPFLDLSDLETEQVSGETFYRFPDTSNYLYPLDKQLLLFPKLKMARTFTSLRKNSAEALTGSPRLSHLKSALEHVDAEKVYFSAVLHMTERLHKAVASKKSLAGVFEGFNDGVIIISDVMTIEIQGEIEAIERLEKLYLAFRDTLEQKVDEQVKNIAEKNTMDGTIWITLSYIAGPLFDAFGPTFEGRYSRLTLDIDADALIIGSVVAGAFKYMIDKKTVAEPVVK